MKDTRLKRTSKGKRPQYFSDPAIDKLMAIVLALAGELSVTRERLDALERLLEKADVMNREELEVFKPSAEVKMERDRARSEYLGRVLRIVQSQLDEASGEDMPLSEEDILRHLS